MFEVAVENSACNLISGGHPLYTAIKVNDADNFISVCVLALSQPRRGVLCLNRRCECIKLRGIVNADFNAIFVPIEASTELSAASIPCSISLICAIASPY